MSRRSGNRSGPAVLGTAGGGLGDASGWAANENVARMGQAGEVRMAAILDPLARPGGVTVLHDLRIPIPGFTANIDHVVVSGRTVLLIDSKMWKPGFYWTVGGKTRRGWRRFAVTSRSGKPAYPAETKTMSMAYDTITRYLHGRGINANITRPVVVVFSSSQRARLTVWMLQFPGARAMTGDAFGRRARGLVGKRGADPVIVAALAELLNNGGSASRRPDRRPPAQVPHEADPFATARPAVPAPRGGTSPSSYETGGGAPLDPWA